MVSRERRKRKGPNKFQPRPSEGRQASFENRQKKFKRKEKKDTKQTPKLGEERHNPNDGRLNVHLLTEFSKQQSSCHPDTWHKLEPQIGSKDVQMYRWYIQN